MELIKKIVNFLSYPQWSFTLVVAAFVLMLRSKGLWSKRGGIILLAGGTLFFLLALLDPNFWLIVSKPDNVPIVMMVFLVGFFVWFAMYKATANDVRVANGEPLFEKTEVEDRIFGVLFDVFGHRKHHATDLPTIKPTVAQILSDPTNLTFRLPSYDPDFPVYDFTDMVDCDEEVAELGSTP
jgi:hypothetical protein